MQRNKEKEKLCVCLQELKQMFDFIKSLMEAASMSSKVAYKTFITTIYIVTASLEP